ncbi:MAG: hypothetical protein MJZ68_09095, partial [archaeon]|nr:hypothetical protein [archaeon]
ESAVVEVKDVEGTYKGDDVSVDEMTVTVTKDEEGKELVEAVVSDIVIGDKVVVKDMTVTVDSGVTTVDAEDVHLDITFDDIDIEVVFDGDIVATVEEDSKSDRVIQSTVTVDKAEVTADGQKTIVDGTDTPASITIEAIYHSEKSEIDTIEAEIDSNGATVIVGDTVYEGFKGTYEKAPETDSSTTYTADTVVKTLDDGTTVTYKGVSKDVLFNAETMIMQKGDEKLVFDNVVSSSIDGTDWRAESFEIDVKEILEEGVTIVDGVVSNYYTGEVAVIDGKIVMFRLNDTVPTEGLSFHMKTETVNMTVNGVHYDVPCGANVVLSGSYEVNGVPVTDDVIVADKDLVIVKAKTVSEVIDKDGNVDLRDGEVVISKDDLEKVSADKIGFIGNNNTSVQMSKKDLETLAGDGSFTIDFGTKEYSSADAGIQEILNAKGLSEKNKEKLKDATFFEFEADGATGEFNKALVTMPFELGDKDPAKLYAYKVNEKGVLKAVDCTYSHDGEKGYVTFEIDGEGTVAVTEKLNSEPTPTPSGDDDKVLYIAAAIFISVLVGAVLTIRHFKGKSE